MSGFLDSVDLKTIFLSNDIIKMTPVSYFISLEVQKIYKRFLRWPLNKGKYTYENAVLDHS